MRMSLETKLFSIFLTQVSHPLYGYSPVLKKRSSIYLFSSGRLSSYSSQTFHDRLIALQSGRATVWAPPPRRLTNIPWTKRFPASWMGHDSDGFRFWKRLDASQRWLNEENWPKKQLLNRVYPQLGNKFRCCYQLSPPRRSHRWPTDRLLTWANLNYRAGG